MKNKSKNYGVSKNYEYINEIGYQRDTQFEWILITQ